MNYTKALRDNPSQPDNNFTLVTLHESKMHSSCTVAY